jgi:hypothetical protein
MFPDGEVRRAIKMVIDPTTVKTAVKSKILRRRMVRSWGRGGLITPSI